MINCILDQPCGLGDIFFCLKIAYTLKENGYKIIWPVNDNLIYIKEYLPDYIDFIQVSSSYPFKEYFYGHNVTTLENSKGDVYIPLRNANMLYGRPVLQAKYKMLDIDYDNWLEYFEIKRDLNRENYLYYDVLKLNDGSIYKLYNRQYGTPPNTAIYNKIPMPTDSIYVEMKYYDGINIFDWCKVIEKAKEIYTIDTSILFIIDKLFQNKTFNHLHLWSRQLDYIDIDGLFKQKYIKH